MHQCGRVPSCLGARPRCFARARGQSSADADSAPSPAAPPKPLPSIDKGFTLAGRCLRLSSRNPVRGLLMNGPLGTYPEQGIAWCVGFIVVFIGLAAVLFRHRIA